MKCNRAFDISQQIFSLTPIILVQKHKLGRKYPIWSTSLMYALEKLQQGYSEWQQSKMNDTTIVFLILSSYLLSTCSY